MIRRVTGVALAGVLLGLTGCSASAPESTPTRPVSPTSPSATTAPAPPPAATARPRPRAGACYDLTYRQALAPTSGVAPVPCASGHTTRTYLVATLPEVQDGHLLAVDSGRVQQGVARTCRAHFAAYVGGTSLQRRLSLLRPVWFTPSLGEADRGADWLRCDVVALSGSGLAPLAVDPKGKPDAYALCGTAQPGTKDFTRVLCRDAHSWRAVSTVDLSGRRYPGEQAARSRAAGPCRQEGAARAADPLSYQWGSEVPTRAQWQAGTTWATCWVPD